MADVARKAEMTRAVSFSDATLGVLVDPEEVVELAPGMAATANGLELDGHPSFESCAKGVRKLHILEKGTGFAIGDAQVYMEEQFGERASQVFDASEGWSLKTLQVYRWLATSISPERRRMDRLGVKHHLLVSGLSPAMQVHWLTLAADSEDEPWTAARLKAAITEGADLPPVSWWLIVRCESEEDQRKLMAELEAAGRTTKAQMGRKQLT